MSVWRMAIDLPAKKRRQTWLLIRQARRQGRAQEEALPRVRADHPGQYRLSGRPAVARRGRVAGRRQRQGPSGRIQDLRPAEQDVLLALRPDRVDGPAAAEGLSP